MSCIDQNLKKKKKWYTKLLRMFISWIPIILGIPQRVCPLEDIKCLISAGLILSNCLNKDSRSFSSYTNKSNAAIQWSNDRFNSNSNLFFVKVPEVSCFYFHRKYSSLIRSAINLAVLVFYEIKLIFYRLNIFEDP